MDNTALATVDTETQRLSSEDLMSEMIDRIATPIAMEMAELTHRERNTMKFPDDFVGDTIDRARSAARAAIVESGIAEKNAEIARLRLALEPFASITEFSPIGDGEIDRVYIEVSIEEINRAQAAFGT